MTKKGRKFLKGVLSKAELVVVPRIPATSFSRTEPTPAQVDRMKATFAAMLRLQLETYLQSDGFTERSRAFLDGDELTITCRAILIANDVIAFRAAVGLDTTQEIFRTALATELRRDGAQEPHPNPDVLPRGIP